MRDPRRKGSVIPSQAPVNRAAGASAYDIEAQTPFKRKFRHGYTAGDTTVADGPNYYRENGVLSTYDSRPVNATDFLRAFVIVNNRINANRGVSVSITNPNGRIGILRSWNINAIFGATIPDVIVNPDGTSNVLTRIGFQLNGIDIPQYSDNFFNSLPFGTLGADCFIPIGQEDTLTFTAIIEPTSPPSIVFLDGEIQLYGNSLIATGRELNLEQATQYSIPVRNV